VQVVVECPCVPQLDPQLRVTVWQLTPTTVDTAAPPYALVEVFVCSERVQTRIWLTPLPP
jgi:hypothetical protein